MITEIQNFEQVEGTLAFEKRKEWFKIFDSLRPSCKNLTDCYYQSEHLFIQRYNHRAYRNEETGVRVYYQEFKVKRQKNKEKNNGQLSMF